MLFIKDFEILDRKYHLADIRYYNMDYFLYFYCNICYHLKKLKKIAGEKPVKKQKLFNFYYSSLWIVLENKFQVIKQHLQIFSSVLEYYYNIKISLVFAILGLYNFIYMYQLENNIYNRK